jgi:hypothetical protein
VDIQAGATLVYYFHIDLLCRESKDAWKRSMIFLLVLFASRQRPHSVVPRMTLRSASGSGSRSGR